MIPQRTMVLLASVGWLQAGAGAGAAAPVALVVDGEPRAALVLPPEPHADEQLAAEEIQTHLEKMSGATLAVAHGGAPDGVLPVRIGLRLAPDLESVVGAKSRDPAAFVVDVRSDGVAVAGLSAEGTLFAAYELLEQLGCRWYLPGELGTVVPRKTTVRLAAGRTVRAPSFPHRHLQTISRTLPWYRRQRLGGMYFPGSHGIRLLPRADFEKEPDLFALRDGARHKRQMCVSNPDVLDRCIAWTLDYFGKNPDAPWVGMGPNDGGGFCECEGCRALDGGEWDPYAAELSVTDRYVWFFNQVLAAVHERYSGKKIGFYAYHTYKLPPRRHKPNPHIVPALAPITLCRIHGMSNPVCPDRSFYKTLMVEWGRLVPEVFERGYYYNLACPGFPFSKVHAVRDETVVAHNAGVKGWRVECMPAWAAHGLTLYVAARLMWDHTVDVDSLLADFYRRFFGPAAKPMGEYLESIDRACRETDCHTGASYPMPRFFGSEWLARAEKLLSEAERRAPAGEVADRVRIYRLSYDHLSAFLEMLDRRNRFDFGAAQKALDSVWETTEAMLGFRLYPGESPAPGIEDTPRGRRDHEARLLWWRCAESFMRRFWSPCTESGYERTVVRGELVAGTPDEWDFLIDTAGVGETLSWQRAGRTGGNWRRMRTRTASWSDQGLHYYKGTAWYRTQVVVPERFRGREVYLWFGGVDEEARVWLNGELLGDSDAPGHGLPGAAGSFKPFEFLATEHVRFGEPNTVAVKVTNQELNEVGTGGITAPVMFWSPAVQPGE